MDMKVLISDAVETSCVDILKEEGFEVDLKTGLPPDELKKIIGGYDVLIVRSSTKVTGEVIGHATNMKVIGRAGAGVDNIDVGAATRRGIVVMNTPGGNTISAAEHTVSLMLSMARNIPQANASLREGKWDRGKFMGTELIGKTIGIIGLGKIGREVAQRCRSFGMTTIGHDPVLSADALTRLDMEIVPLEEIFRRSDFITVHTPLNKDTKGLIGEQQFAMCKKGVRVINCARGGIIDEAALFKALESGVVAGAALDVFVQEPPTGSPLITHSRVVATPHLGASTEEAQEKVARQIAVQIADLLKERGMAGAVNAEPIVMALRSDVKPFVMLAERMGMLATQLVPGKLKSLSVGYAGALLVQSMETMTASVLKGVFSKLLTEPVNLVNAPLIAREFGLTVSEQRDIDGGSYTHLLRVKYETDEGRTTLQGTVFGSDLSRIVQIDEYRLELNPDGHLLIYGNIDRPGVLASVGSVLAQNRINIGGLSLGRTSPGGKALTIMDVDHPITPDVLQAIGTIDGVFNVRMAHLP